MSQIQQKYQDYLQRLGIQSMSSQSDFWQQLKDYHGDWEVHQFTQAVINGNQQSAYDFLYQDLNSCKIAYHMVSLQSTQVLESIDEALQKMDKKKSKLVVELGCGFGLQLCFLALLKPKLTFIGFDCSEKAIQSAQALAQSLQLKNIRFERQSIETISTDQSKLKQACGLVFSSLLQQEIKSCIGNEWLPDDEFEAQALQCDEIQYEALMQYALNACVQNQQQGTFPVIEAAQFLIHPLTGTYISYERLANGLDYCTWVGMLIQKGLQVHFKESQIIQSYHVLHQCYEKIPLFVAHPTFGSVMRLLDARQG